MEEGIEDRREREREEIERENLGLGRGKDWDWEVRDWGVFVGKGERGEEKRWEGKM